MYRNNGSTQKNEGVLLLEKYALMGVLLFL